MPKWFQTFTNNSAIISNVKTLLTNSLQNFVTVLQPIFIKSLEKETMENKWKDIFFETCNKSMTLFFNKVKIY